MRGEIKPSQGEIISPGDIEPLGDYSLLDILAL